MIPIGGKSHRKRYGAIYYCLRNIGLNIELATQGQTFMVIGAAGELPKPPSQPVVFLEGAYNT